MTTGSSIMSTGCIVKGYIKLNGMTIKRVADDLGITSKTLHIRLKDGDFTFREMSGLINLLEIERPQEVFFRLNNDRAVS